MKSVCTIALLLVAACQGPQGVEDYRLLGQYELTDFWFRFNDDTVRLRDAYPGAHLTLTFDLEARVQGSGQLTFRRWPTLPESRAEVFSLLSAGPVTGTYHFEYANVVRFHTGRTPPDSLRWQLHLQPDRRDRLVTFVNVDALTEGRIELRRRVH